MLKRFFSKISILCSTLFLGTSMLSGIPVHASTAYTGMRNITSMQVVKDMKVGWNLGNTLDASPDETGWGAPKTTKAMIDEIKKAGFNTVRIPITWKDHIGAAPNYTIDKAWLDRVQEVVNYVLDNNMYAIINVHHDDPWVVPNSQHEGDTVHELSLVWNQIANRFKNYSDYLIFETLNEPREVGSATEWSGGTDESRQAVNQYNLTAVNAIRSTGGNNSSRFIMVPTYAASVEPAAMNALTIPNNDSRVIVSLHMYAPYYFAMDTSDLSVSTWGSDADKAALDSQMDAIYNKFIKNGTAVVIGEFGSIDKNNLSSRVAHAKYYVSAARKRGITPIWWDNGAYNPGQPDTYAIFNRTMLSWYYPDLVKALVDSAN
ncbi:MULTISPECIES: glycoside hydrolase family 5 protein [Clostridium]|uniref:glycoside hydrolase family 5 protein n=1 Tax=Clostridium TaxID=1485 RepID=UPI0008241DAE|nr:MULTISPECIES: glycoside hydrolase family 5 protein [Clostridium]PJI07528.1 endoglucanase [Clostridium sp. CT7]